MITIEFERIHLDAKIPVKVYDTDAGMDVASVEDINIMPRHTVLVHTGLKVRIPKGHEIQVRSRSGLALKFGISVLNSPGTIDANFSGEIGIILRNNRDVSFFVTKGMRIAQLVVAQVPEIEIVEVDKIEDVGRGSSGFGSTGTH